MNARAKIIGLRYGAHCSCFEAPIVCDSWFFSNPAAMQMSKSATSVAGRANIASRGLRFKARCYDNFQSFDQLIVAQPGANRPSSTALAAKLT